MADARGGRPVKAGQFAVRCPDFEIGGLRDRATAERRLAEVERLGACRQDHVIVDLSQVPDEQVNP